MNFIRFETIEGEEILINLEQVVSIEPHYNYLKQKTVFSDIVLTTSKLVSVRASFDCIIELLEK